MRQARPGSDVAVGERSFGKAYVNCALLGVDSKWEIFRDKDAADLQLLIDPRQDEGFKLRELVLELSFTECEPQLAATSSTLTTTAAEPSLVILEPPSPKYLRAKSTTQHVSRELMA